MNALSFEDLHMYYRTDRFQTVSKNGRNRITVARHGIQCALGDLEETEWRKLACEVIERAGEQDLHQNLIHFLRDERNSRSLKEDVEQEALIAHTARFFDNPLWVDFIKFNRKYRPTALEGIELVWIKTCCCPRPGLVTKSLATHHRNSIYCPHCGRWSPYEILNNYETEEHK